MIRHRLTASMVAAMAGTTVISGMDEGVEVTPRQQYLSRRQEKLAAAEEKRAVKNARRLLKKQRGEA